jgi:hypothetical protein
VMQLHSPLLLHPLSATMGWRLLPLRLRKGRILLVLVDRVPRRNHGAVNEDRQALRPDKLADHSPSLATPQSLFDSHSAQMTVDNCCCLLAALGIRPYRGCVRSLWRDRVNPRVERYLDRAKECERMAAQAKKRQAAFLTRDAQQWRELARQAEYWERVRDMMPENLRRNQSTPLLRSIELGDELGLRAWSV